MSIPAKQLFTKEVTERLSDKLTMKDIDAVVQALTDEMVLYDMERREDQATQKDFEELLKVFIDSKRVEGRQESTLTRYAYILHRFRAYDPTPIRELTVYNFRQYLAREKDRGICDNTLRGVRDVFDSFFGWLYDEGLLPKNPCQNLNPIKVKKVVRKPYSDVDLEQLKENCVTLRDKAIVSFLLSTGCRVGEVFNLNRDDIDFQNKECTVLGKGNKERTVYMDDVAAMQLKRYLDSRTDKLDALFIGKGTKRLSPNGMRKRLHKIADWAEVEKVHPHRFRRTFATILIDHGMPVQEVANLMGHEKLDTTMGYYYIDKQNVKNSYRKYS